MKVGTEESYVSGAYCTTKRHTVRVVIGTTVSSNSELTVTLVGIRNPDTEQELTYTMAVMDYYDKLDPTRNSMSTQYYKNSIQFFATVIYKFLAPTTALLDLISVETTVP